MASSSSRCTRSDFERESRRSLIGGGATFSIGLGFELSSAWDRIDLSEAGILGVGL